MQMWPLSQPRWSKLIYWIKIFSPISVDINNLGWDCFVEGQIPQSLLIAIKPMYIRYNPRGSVDIWGSRLIKSLIGLTHKQWLFQNSDVHYISKGLTAHQHNQLTARICELMKTKHKILLPRHRHFIQIDFDQLGQGPALACQVWVANMEMAISIAKIAWEKFCTHKSLRLLSTPQTVSITQTLPLLPSMKVCSTDESPPKIHPMFSTPCFHARKDRLSMTPCTKSHNHHWPSIHRHLLFLPATNLGCKRTPMTKVSWQLFSMFCPSVAPWPYDKIMAHHHRLHIQKKIVIFTGSSLIW